MNDRYTWVRFALIMSAIYAVGDQDWFRIGMTFLWLILAAAFCFMESKRLKKIFEQQSKDIEDQRKAFERMRGAIQSGVEAMMRGDSPPPPDDKPRLNS